MFIFYPHMFFEIICFLFIHVLGIERFQATLLNLYRNLLSAYQFKSPRKDITLFVIRLTLIGCMWNLGPRLDCHGRIFIQKHVDFDVERNQKKISRRLYRFT